MSSTPTRLRAAVVGTGGIVTGSHLPAPRTHANRIELRAAVDVDPARLDAFRAEAGAMGMDIEGQADFDAMLDAVHPGPVLIDNPPSRHRAQTVAALNAGAWVLCEKPLYLSLAEYDEIAATETLRERTRRWSSSTEPGQYLGVYTMSYMVSWPLGGYGEWTADGCRYGERRLDTRLSARGASRRRDGVERRRAVRAPGFVPDQRGRPSQSGLLSLGRFGHRGSPPFRLAGCAARPWPCSVPMSKRIFPRGPPSPVASIRSASAC